MSSPRRLLRKPLIYFKVLGDEGLSYGDYVELLTFLLFLKMADEQSRPPFNKTSAIPKGYDWPSLLAKDWDESKHPNAGWGHPAYNKTGRDPVGRVPSPGVPLSAFGGGFRAYTLPVITTNSLAI